jgi:hypothetical protein
MSSQTQEAINEGICSHMSVVPNTDRDSLPCLVKVSGWSLFFIKLRLVLLI